MEIRRFLLAPVLIIWFSGCVSVFCCSTVARTFTPVELESFINKQSGLKTYWEGHHKVSPSLSILVMAGHADSQGIAGAGTAGAAVDLRGASPMDESMSDELFWNLKIRDAVVEIGKKRGLNIFAYEPGIRNIVDGNDERTNWSKGARHAREGGYSLEIHFDSYGEYGFGSGLIPALSRNLNKVDESLAQAFGRYPLFFRGGLGGPRREIRILEIGKLEGKLEDSLRDISSRKATITTIASRIVQALIIGVRG